VRSRTSISGVSANPTRALTMSVTGARPDVMCSTAAR
jgi:hypothetical protein